MPTPITTGPWQEHVGKVIMIVHYATTFLLMLCFFGYVMLFLALYFLYDDLYNDPYKNKSWPSIILFGCMFCLGLFFIIDPTYKIYNPIPYVVIGEKGIFINNYTNIIPLQNICKIDYTLKRKRRRTYKTITLQLKNGNKIFISDNNYYLNKDVFAMYLEIKKLTHLN